VWYNRGMENQLLKKGTFKKYLKYALLALPVIVLINVVPALFYAPVKNSLPMLPEYKRGVFHVHSNFSDGKGSVAEIMWAANETGLDFVVLTDHGRPNLKGLRSTAWFKDSLLIGGSEFSLSCGHLACVGFKSPDYIFPPEAQQAVDEVIDENVTGACFISHPFDKKIPWTDWSIKNVTGLEVFSSYSEARKAGLLKLLMFPLKYALNSRYALLNTMNYPKRNLAKWDEFNKGANQRVQFYGIFALDAHAKLPVSKKFQLNFPTYRSMFQIMSVYVRTNKALDGDAHHAAAAVAEALKLGRFFNVLDAIAPANGFDAYFVEKVSGKRIDMGGVSAVEAGEIVIVKPFEFFPDIKVFKDGGLVRYLKGNRDRLMRVDVNERGVYRLELFIPGSKFDELPWIVVNPFFIGMAPPLVDDSVLKNAAVSVKRLVDGMLFQIEKNGGSKGLLSYDEELKETTFSFKLMKESAEDPNFWSVLSLRRGFDFSQYRGFVFEVKGNRRLRVWLEFRTGKGEYDGSETWYKHSFLIEPQWRKVVIPFAAFASFVGKKQSPNAAEIQSIFFAINNACAYPGTEGEMVFKNFGVY